MSMPVLERRLQILIDSERYGRLERYAAAQGRPVGAVVRGAIDQLLAQSQASRAAAVGRFLARPTANEPEPDWGGVKRELENDLFDGIGA
jgi:hypothetical protein